MKKSKTLLAVFLCTLLLAFQFSACGQGDKPAAHTAGANLKQVITHAFSAGQEEYLAISDIMEKTTADTLVPMRQQERELFDPLFEPWMTSEGVESLYMRWRVDWLMPVFTQLGLQTQALDIKIEEGGEGRKSFSFTFSYSAAQGATAEQRLQGSAQYDETGKITFFALEDESQRMLRAISSELLLDLLDNKT